MKLVIGGSAVSPQKGAGQKFKNKAEVERYPSKNVIDHTEKN
jgi:hypothetical protein